MYPPTQCSEIRQLHTRHHVAPKVDDRSGPCRTIGTIPDCSEDFAQIDPGETVILDTNSRTCIVDEGADGSVLRCLVFHSPLVANAVLRISEARRVAPSHPCH
jgi:hypothetical protein